MRAWRRYLLPRDESRDPAFRREVLELSVIGLRAAVLICVTGPALMLSVTTV